MASTIQKFDESTLKAFESALQHQDSLRADVPEVEVNKSNPVDSRVVWTDFVSTRDELIQLRQEFEFVTGLASKLPASPADLGESTQDRYWRTLATSIERKRDLASRILEAERRIKSLKAYLLAEMEF